MAKNNSRECVCNTNCMVGKGFSRMGDTFKLCPLHLYKVWFCPPDRARSAHLENVIVWRTCLECQGKFTDTKTSIVATSARISSSSGMGSNRITATNFLELLMILELYLELSCFLCQMVTVTKVTKVPK